MDVRGLRVVVTGKVVGESRQTAEAKLRDAGAIVQSAVGGTTDLLVTGDRVGASKTNKARELGVRVESWDAVMNGAEDEEPAPAAPAASAVGARTVAPMMAKAGELPIGPEWLFEIKWDGLRCIATVDGDRVTMQSRTGKSSYVESFPHVAAELRHVADGTYDGELVVVGGNVPVGGPMDGAKKLKASYVVFDLLDLDSRADGVVHDLRNRPLVERRELLEVALDPGVTGCQWIAVSPRFDDGEQLLEIVKENGGEGVVAKRRESRYVEGSRTDSWRKIKVRHEQDFAVVGWKPGEGSREDEAGSILVAWYDAENGMYVYAGRVGTGQVTASDRLPSSFWQDVVKVSERFSPLPTPDWLQTNAAPLAELRDVVWLEPGLVVQVQFQRWTEDGRLWHPSVVGVRTDVGPQDCRREG